MTSMWRGLCLLGILLSLVALGIAMTCASTGSKEEIAARVLADRERVLVAQAKEPLKRLRREMGLPDQEVKTIEDLFAAFFGTMEGLGTPRKK